MAIIAKDDKKRMAQWKKGLHIDGDDKSWKLEEMSFEHLENTIKLFGKLDLDVRPLEDALLNKQGEAFAVVIEFLKSREKAALNFKNEKVKERARSVRKARKALEAFVNAKT